MVLEIKPNKENWRFYDRIPEGMLQKYAEKLGLDDTPELDWIDGTWKRAKGVLEIGAGAGRIIDGLRQRSYSGQIYALERCPLLCSRLRKKYHKHKRLEILQGSVLDFEIPQADIGLWMWAGILEFSAEEQEKAIIKLCRSLETLCVEVPALGEINATHQEGQVAYLSAPWGETIHYYLPSSEEMQKYTEKSCFKSLQHTQYWTKTGRGREVYILKK